MDQVYLPYHADIRTPPAEVIYYLYRLVIPGGKFLGRMDDFRIEISNIVVRATPTMKNTDIFTLQSFFKKTLSFTVTCLI